MHPPLVLKISYHKFVVPQGTGIGAAMLVNTVLIPPLNLGHSVNTLSTINNQPIATTTQVMIHESNVQMFKTVDPED